MTDEEHAIFVTLMRQIEQELSKPADEHQDAILVGYIGLVLNYCQRFYDRQFITRKPENTDVLMRFDALLHTYYEESRQLSLGLPTVQYCAEQLCMSPNYFGDLIRRTTGDTAGNHIRQYVIRRAQDALAAGATIAETADRLGFEYPQHFSRMFKRQTGLTPRSTASASTADRQSNRPTGNVTGRNPHQDSVPLRFRPQSECLML